MHGSNGGKPACEKHVRATTTIFQLHTEVLPSIGTTWIFLMFEFNYRKIYATKLKIKVFHYSLSGHFLPDVGFKAKWFQFSLPVAGTISPAALATDLVAKWHSLTACKKHPLLTVYILSIYQEHVMCLQLNNSSCTDLNIINLWMKLQKIAESNKHNNSRGILGYNQKLHIEMSSLPGTSLRTCNEKYVSIQSCNRSAPSQVWRHFFSWTVTNNLLWKEECILLDHDIFMMASCTTSFFLQAKTKTFINLLTIACVKLLPNFVTSFGLQRATQFYFPYIAYQFLLDPAVFILGHLN